MTKLTRRYFLSSALGVLATSATTTALAADGGADELDAAGLEALLAEVAKARRGVTSLEASFTQARRLSLLATEVKSTGRMTFLAPDKLRWELAAPDDVTYWIGPSGVAFKTKSGAASVAPESAKTAKALADVRALIGGDLGSLRERYELRGTRRADEAEIGGTAKDPKASVKSFVLVLDKGLALPKRARLVEGKRDTIEITFRDARVNAPVDPARMKPA